MTVEDLISIRSIGSKSVTEIVQFLEQRELTPGGEEEKLHEVIADVANRIFEEYPGEKLIGRNLAHQILVVGHDQLGSLKIFEHTRFASEFYEIIYDGLKDAVREGLLGIVPKETTFTPNK